MDFSDTQEQAAFRQRLRNWLETNTPVAPETDNDEIWAQFRLDWHKALYAAGWLGLSWPTSYGGQGLTTDYELILNDELGSAGAPPRPYVGYLGRAMIRFASEHQKRRYLPGLLSGTERWCQGFSEPGAGSDLASMRTSAVLADDEYVVNGHKIWTSDAIFADWCLLLARTDPDAPKHKGISALLVDMHAPGITVQPIVQITGSREFCEVFFDDVKVPVGQRVGDPGDGWPLAMETFVHERSPAVLGFTSRYMNTVGKMERALRHQPEGRRAAAEQEVAARYVDVEVLRLYMLWSLAERGEQTHAGAESSIDKLLMTWTEQRLYHSASDLAGAPALLGRRREVLHDYLYSRAQSIMGGTEQIQRGIVAQRVLGLPR